MGELVIWDTMGAEQYRAIPRVYFRDAAAAVLLYDITDERTFANTRSWLDEVRQTCQPNMQVLLIGNKTDREEERRVSRADAHALTSDYPEITRFEETSARNGDNVRNAFES